MTVGELLSRISSRELSEWMEYAKLEPFGEERADLRAGIVAATVANAHRKRGARALRPADFMPRWEAEQGRPQTPEEQIGLAAMITAALGGRDLRGEKAR